MPKSEVGGGGGEDGGGWVEEAVVCCLYPNQTILQEQHISITINSIYKYCTYSTVHYKVATARNFSLYMFKGKFL